MQTHCQIVEACFASRIDMSFAEIAPFVVLVDDGESFLASSSSERLSKYRGSTGTALPGGMVVRSSPLYRTHSAEVARRKSGRTLMPCQSIKLNMSGGPSGGTRMLLA